MPRSAIALSALTVFALTTARAQSTVSSRSSLSIGAGAAFSDLFRAGAAPMVAARGDLPLGNLVSFDGGLVVALPTKPFIRRNSLLVPEVGMELHLPSRVAPYIGADIGRTFNFGDRLGDANEISYSAALGTRVWMTEQRGLVAEFRLRGIDQRFTGSAGELTVGMVWR